jgi:hypothetical protein
VSAPQYGLSWPNAKTAIVHKGRSAAHGLHRIWAKTGIVPTVVVRDGWNEPWREDAPDQSEEG